MNVSIIDDDKVSESKGGFLCHVSDVVELKDLNEFAELLTLCHVAPATFADNIKRQDHLHQISFVCFDFDDGVVTAMKVHERLKHEFNHVIVGSKNHLKDKGDGKGVIERFHVFIPTDKPIISVELYKYIGKKFSRLMQWKVDNNCIEPARYFYKHSSILNISDTGNNLDVERFEKLKKLDENCQLWKQKHSVSKYQLSDKPPIEVFKTTKAYKDMTCGVLSGDGQRYAVSNRIIGVMIKCGVDISDALSLFDSHSSYGTNFTRNSIERRFNQWK